MVRIRPKKHHGVKDPEKQQLRRLESISGKINDPPNDPDYQPVPKSVARLAELMKQSSQIQKGKKQNMKKKSKQTSAFFKSLGTKVSQGKNEPDRLFLNRIHKTANKVIEEQKFEEKYDIKVERNLITGEIALVKSKEKLFKEKLSETRKLEKQKKENKKLKQSGVDKVKLVEKVKEPVDSMQELREKRDQILFGEIVHEPPTLTVPPKIAKMKEASMPGKRNLLLKSNLGGSTQTTQKNKVANASSLIVDKTAKRKKLPIHVRQQLENQQKEVMDVYRALKKTKQMSKA